MQPILGFDNVWFDQNSQFQFSDLKETEYFTGILEGLHSELGQRFQQFNFYVFVQNGPLRAPASVSHPAANKVLLYLSDESSSYPGPWRENYVAVFKCYLKNDPDDGNVFPIPLGFVDGFQAQSLEPASERAISVFFAGNLNAGRIPLFRELSLLRHLPLPLVRALLTRKAPRALLVRGRLRGIEDSYIRFTRGFMSGLSRAEFNEKLHDARIALCPSGFDSVETFRHFEAMKAGCVIVSPRLPDTWMYRDSPIIQTDDWKQGMEMVQKLLSDEQALEQRQRATIAWWQERCSEPAVARYIAERLPVHPTDQ